MSATTDLLHAELKDAMRNRDTVRKTVIRSLLAAITEAETAGGTRSTLDDAGAIKVMRKQADQRRQSAGIYTEAGDSERAAAEIAEADIIDGFLPAQVSEDDLRLAVKEILSGLPEDKKQGGAAIGTVMKSLKERFDDFDGKLASTLIRQELQG